MTASSKTESKATESAGIMFGLYCAYLRTNGNDTDRAITAICENHESLVANCFLYSPGLVDGHYKASEGVKAIVSLIYKKQWQRSGITGPITDRIMTR